MSNKTKLIASMRRVSRRIDGAHETQEARDKTIAQFAQVLYADGYKIVAANQIGGRHLRLFADRRLAAGVTVRTLANGLAHLRSILYDIDKDSLADDPNFSNKSLGAAGGSKLGTKEPLTDEELTRVWDRAAVLSRPGFGAILHLEFRLGLRAREGICATETVLARWQEQLEHGDTVTIEFGTKGGRPRHTRVPDQEKARLAILFALEVARSQGGYLLARADGKPLTLKSAEEIYRSWMSRAGVQGHAVRYRFAHDLKAKYLAEGRTEEDADKLVSIALGHGEGRGRYVRSVYGRTFNRPTAESRSIVSGSTPRGGSGDAEEPSDD